MHAPRPLVWFIGALSVGCGAGLPSLPPEGAPVSYVAHLEPYVLARCESCHTADDPKAGLVLEPGVGRGNMLGVGSTQRPDMVLVAPGEPERSYLWLKVDHRAPTGDGMPRTLFGSKRLPEGEVELYRRWIEGGALP
jgi:hypothetical protein